MTPIEKLLKLAERYEWRDISTFPKYQDEETVLLKDERHAVAGYFREEELSGFYYHDYPDDYNLYTIEPTHWMPLPDGNTGGIIRILVEALNIAQATVGDAIQRMKLFRDEPCDIADIQHIAAISIEALERSYALTHKTLTRASEVVT